MIIITVVIIIIIGKIFRLLTLVEKPKFVLMVPSPLSFFFSFCLSNLLIPRE